VLRLYVGVRGGSSVSVGVLGGVLQGEGKIGGASVGESAAEDGDEVLPSVGLRHEFPSLSGLGVAAECSFHQRRRVELGFHGFHQIFSGVLGAAQARVFFLDFADLAVDLLTLRVGQGVEEFLEAFGLAEFAGEGGMDWHGEVETLPRMGRIFTDRAGKRFTAKDAKGAEEMEENLCRRFPRMHADLGTSGERQSLKPQRTRRNTEENWNPYKK
jgi:hypothetical protein